ncbi:AI-2E family transporter [soil metagenome]
MSNSKAGSSNAVALTGIWALVVTTFVIAALYFARDIFIPLALATLVTFLLAPLVTAIEHTIGRIAAVLVSTFLVISAIGGIAWILSSQFGELATNLPIYKQNITAKLRALHLPIDDPVPAPEPAAATSHSPQPATQDVLHTSPGKLVQMAMASLLSPLGNAALVTLLAIFMLINREDLRSRFIRIIGHGRISTTTRAMDDAGFRVARYLLLLLAVNLSFGAIITVGLALLGLPNAILWGSLAALLRFIPYVGCWIAAALPFALALAVSTSWTTPLSVLGLFLVVEIVNANFLEPWLYGTHTGVSPFALIVAAIFWTWLWGPIGLLLSTPLTVCLVVMGRHVPRLSFLSTILSDEKSLTPPEECYRRLSSVGLNEAGEYVDAFLKTHSLLELYDTMLVPVVVVAEIDRHRQTLDEEHLDFVEQGVADIVEDLQTRPALASSSDASLTNPAPQRVHCLPARARRDDLASAMLAHLLREKGLSATTEPIGVRDVAQTIAIVKESAVDLLCITVVPPSTVIQARFLCAKLTQHFPELNIVVMLWGSLPNLTDASERLYKSGASQVAINLEGTIKLVEELTTASRASSPA